MDLHCPLTCGRCRTRRDMRISGQKIKMSDWGKLWSKKGKPQKLQCCRVQSKGVRNLESGNFFSWNRESCALEFRIQITNPDPTIDWNPEHDPSSTDKESGIHYLYLRSGIMGETVLDFLTWGELSLITVVAAAQNVQTITSCYWRAPVTLGNAYELVDIAYVYPTK